MNENDHLNHPPTHSQLGNWLPTPANGPFGYVLRIYGPGGNAKPISELKEPLQVRTHPPT